MSDWPEVPKESNREKILQQNMLNLFKYIDELESRIRVIEEELMRYDFGYDPVETLQRKFKEKEGFDIWKVKFGMDKPDSEDPHAKHWGGKGHTDRYGS